MATNPFPAIMGRVCYHPCEISCNRGQLDEAVGINSVERFLGDEAIRLGWRVELEAEPTGKSVLVVGSGPSGLAAAYHLALLGHAVTIREASPKAGGMMRYGIPAYRLPRDVLDAEVQRILDVGVVLELNAPVRDVLAEKTAGGYDAVFLAVGAQIGRRAYIPAGSAAHVVDAISMLHGVETGDPPLLGRRVAVYGGGNTAMDAARTAKRLGVSDAIVVYRRTRDKMPAHESELREAEEEGALFKWLSTVTQADDGVLTVEKMELDDNGFPQPTGVTEDLAADSCVHHHDPVLTLDIGNPLHQGEVGLLAQRQDQSLMTGLAGVFAGGDLVPDERSVTVAVGHGRRAADNIDDWLAGRSPQSPPQQDLADFSVMNTWYYADAPRAHRPVLEMVRRQSTFDEVVRGFDPTKALYEARRCMSCGNCFSCDNCYSVCPDNAVLKVGAPGEEYVIDLDYCKGCGLCAAECPSGAISMVPEDV
jgi:NADPH-dependent glutamate synthase beta subunit-like oxidoreductase